MPAVNPSPGPLSALAPYAGRWIALVRDHVAGVGRTAAEARALSKALRPKEEPLIVFIPESAAEPADPLAG